MNSWPTLLQYVHFSLKKDREVSPSAIREREEMKIVQTKDRGKETLSGTLSLTVSGMHFVSFGQVTLDLLSSHCDSLNWP